MHFLFPFPYLPNTFKTGYPRQTRLRGYPVFIGSDNLFVPYLDREGRAYIRTGCAQ